MGSRRAARELALQALYQVDLLGDGQQDARSLALFWEHFDPAADPEVREFARALVDGVREQRERIDALIARAAEHWRLPRLSRVDLSLLRLGTFELIGRPEIPASVTLNEAVEIARRFGSEESASFVNGVLDHVARQVGAQGLAGASEEGGWRRRRNGCRGTIRGRWRRSGSGAGRSRGRSPPSSIGGPARTTCSRCSPIRLVPSTWGTCATTPSAT